MCAYGVLGVNIICVCGSSAGWGHCLTELLTYSCLDCPFILTLIFSRWTDFCCFNQAALLPVPDERVPVIPPVSCAECFIVTCVMFRILVLY